MVERDKKDVLVVGEPDEFGTYHDITTEIKRFASFLGSEPLELEFPIRPRSIGEIDEWEVEAGDSCNPLTRFAFDSDQCCAQSLVARNHGNEGRLKTLRTGRAGEAERMGQVVNGAMWLQLVQEPKSMLRERQGRSVRLSSR